MQRDPRAWWLFAFRCLSWERAQRLCRFDKARLLKTLVLWVEYAGLYRRYLHLQDATAGSTRGVDAIGSAHAGVSGAAGNDKGLADGVNESGRMRVLEDELPLQVVVLAREAVVRQRRRESVVAVQRNAGGDASTVPGGERVADATVQSDANSGGLLRRVSGWIWKRKEGGMQSVARDHDGRGKGRWGAGGATVSDARRKFMEEIGAADDDGHEGSHGRDGEEEAGVDSSQHVALQLSFILQGGSLTLLTSDGVGDASGGWSRGVAAGEQQALTRITYENLRVELTSRSSSMALQVRLKACAVDDLRPGQATGDFAHIISRCLPEAHTQGTTSSPSKYANEKMRLGVLGGGRGGLLRGGLGSLLSGTGKGERDGDAEEKAWQGDVVFLRYESNPVERNQVKADSRLVLRVDRMTVVYNPAWVSQVVGFMDVGQSDAMRHLADAAAERFVAAKRASEENLKAALATKLLMDVEVEVRAPVILIPESFHGGGDGTVEVVNGRGGDAVVVLQPGNLSLWSLKKVHLSNMSRLLCAMESADAVDERFYNSMLVEVSEVYVLVSNSCNCWDVARDPRSV